MTNKYNVQLITDVNGKPMPQYYDEIEGVMKPITRDNGEITGEINANVSFPETQNVNGTVSVDNFPKTQQVEVTNQKEVQDVNVINQTTSVDVNNFPELQDVSDAQVRAELEQIKATQAEILERLNEPVETQVTGSIIDYQDFSFTDLNENEREVMMLKPPESTYYKVISISFDIRPKKELHLRAYLGDSDLVRRFFEIKSGSNMFCFNNYLSVNFDDVLYGPKTEIEGLEVFKNIYGTHELPIYFSIGNSDNMLEDGIKRIRVIYEVIR